jgi:pimeloyl-ACP methyl ester carboxylesterase
MEDALKYPGYPVVKQPALIFHGRQDDVVPQELVDEFVRQTPQAEYHLLDSGHELTDCLEYMWDHARSFV